MMMKLRRKSREMALQALFYMDSRRNLSMEALTLYRRCFPPSQKTEPFFDELSKGVMQRREQIDRAIERFSSNWKINRMSCVDRNIMRIAVYEMLFIQDIPFKVSINEAIEIGKKYGTEESGAFINGILDSIHLALEQGKIRPEVEARTPVPERIPADADSAAAASDAPEQSRFSRVKGRPGVVKKRRGTDRPPRPEEPSDQ